MFESHMTFFNTTACARRCEVSHHFHQNYLCKIKTFLLTAANIHLINVGLVIRSGTLN